MTDPSRSFNYLFLADLQCIKNNIFKTVPIDGEARGETLDRVQNQREIATEVISIALHLSSIMLSDRASVVSQH